MTDNGSVNGASFDADLHMIEGFNAGMRGRKVHQYDGGHRVPFFIRWPDGGIDAKRDIGKLAANVDFMPTILDLCGIVPPENRTFHGVSLTDLIYGRDNPVFDERIVVTDCQQVAIPVKYRQGCAMKGNWRLVNHKELYDVTEDVGQKNDVAKLYPEMVLELQEAYEEWWKLVSQKMYDEIPIPIGGEETLLCAHDLRGIVADVVVFQGDVREGKKHLSYFEVEALRDGKYTFELRRWCCQNGGALTAGIETDDIDWNKRDIEPGKERHYTGGVALEIERAFIEIGGQRKFMDIDPDSTSAVFELELKAGQHRLKAGFTDKSGGLFCAYYVYVR